MPILVLPVVLALTAVGVDRDIAAADVAVKGEPSGESVTFDPKQPPRWWLNKMQRPCAPTGGRVSC